MFEQITDSGVRYDAMLVLSVRNGNPNGNPDMDNLPRTNLDGKGLISDVSTKRRVRDHILVNHAGEDGNGIFVQPGVNMQVVIAAAAGTSNDNSDKKKGKKGEDTSKDQAIQAVGTLLSDFWDVRMFGGVLSVGDLAQYGTFAKVQGPSHVAFGESIEPVSLSEHAITRVVHADADKEDKGTMGRKQVVDEGVYLVRVGYNPNLTKVINRKFDDEHTDYRISKERSDADLALLWEGLYHLYGMRSASIGDANVLGLVVFQHSSELGDAPAHRLMERVAVEKVTGGPTGTKYEVLVDDSDLPSGVTVHRFA